MNKFVRNGMDLGKSFFKYNGIWLLCLKIEREVDVNCLVLLSPSVRKVWIEMSPFFYNFPKKLSPSVRKVWIEMIMVVLVMENVVVTFCEEGVD